MFDKYKNTKDFLQVDNVEKGKKYPPFIDHLFSKIDEHIDQDGRILILTLTKQSAEEVTDFLVSKWYKAYYLHSEIDTDERWEIIKKLRSGQIDILIGINLLREWIDLPEVTFMWILDADKKGFLRSTTSLIQIIGRAARNPNSEVVLYGDEFTEPMIKSLRETHRRRKIQKQHNEKNDITPQKAMSNVKDLEMVKTDEEFKPQKHQTSKKKLKRMTKKEKKIILKDLKKQLQKAVDNWEFKKAEKLKQQINEIE